MNIISMWNQLLKIKCNNHFNKCYFSKVITSLTEHNYKIH